MRPFITFPNGIEVGPLGTRLKRSDKLDIRYQLKGTAVPYPILESHRH